MKYKNVIIFLFVVVISFLTLSACSKTNSNINSDIICTQDVKICADGTSLSRDPAKNCEFPLCSDEPIYISKDKEECMRIKFICSEDKEAFFDESGCGCKPIKEVKIYDCTEPRPEFCTKEYMPVCGLVQVQCIRAPCEPIKQTFGNKCEACSNKLTISYTEGACEENSVNDTVLSGKNKEQCINIGGKWTGYDCENIDYEKCQEIGGTFNECASACRNNPGAQMCTLQCVPVCEFK
ncbi:MAG: hypothetical protein QXK76_02380 [Candidatus Woesearchaeota archaeon]